MRSDTRPSNRGAGLNGLDHNHSPSPAGDGEVTLKTFSAKEVFMSESNPNVKAATRQTAKAAAEVPDSVSPVAHAVTDGAHTVAHKAREAAGRVAEAVEENCEHAGRAARHSFERGRHLARRWENGFERAVRSNPLVSLLIATGIGVAFGLLWHRRRP